MVKEWDYPWRSFTEEEPDESNGVWNHSSSMPLRIKFIALFVSGEGLKFEERVAVVTSIHPENPDSTKLLIWDERRNYLKHAYEDNQTDTYIRAWKPLIHTVEQRCDYCLNPNNIIQKYMCCTGCSALVD